MVPAVGPFVVAGAPGRAELDLETVLVVVAADAFSQKPEHAAARAVDGMVHQRDRPGPRGRGAQLVLHPEELELIRAANAGRIRRWQEAAHDAERVRVRDQYTHPGLPLALPSGD